MKEKKKASLLQKIADSDNADYRLKQFTAGILDGMNMKQAALAAGYSEHTANQAGRVLMPRANLTFRAILENFAPLGKQARRIAEGMDAMETKFFAHEGVVTDQRDVIAWDERRRYLELAARCQGLLIDKIEHTGANGEPIQIEIQHIGAPAKVIDVPSEE